MVFSPTFQVDQTAHAQVSASRLLPPPADTPDRPFLDCDQSSTSPLQPSFLSICTASVVPARSPDPRGFCRPPCCRVLPPTHAPGDPARFLDQGFSSHTLPPLPYTPVMQSGKPFHALLPQCTFLPSHAPLPPCTFLLPRTSLLSGTSPSGASLPPGTSLPSVWEHTDFRTVCVYRIFVRNTTKPQCRVPYRQSDANEAATRN